MGKFGKKNHVKLDPLAYSICLLGESKVGKTTLIKEVCQKLAGDDGYMFLEIDKEHGADAIEGIKYEDVVSWDEPDRDIDPDTGEEIVNGVGFMEVVEDIIENKVSDYPKLKVIVIDTYDQIIPLAEQKVVSMWNKKNPDKRVDTINAAFGGFGKGEKEAMKIMFDSFEALRRVGVQTIIIGHTKNKDVHDPVTGESYQILTSDQQQNYFNALKKNIHFLGLAYIDREIVKEKTGTNKVTKKDEYKSVVKNEARKVKFRDDNYAVDSGSRFAEIVPEIPLDADAFIKAITDAIKAEQSKSGVSLKDTEKEQEEEEAKRLKVIAEKEKVNRTKKELDKNISIVVSFINENKSNVDKFLPIIEKVKEFGYASGNPKEVTDVKQAEKLAKMCK